MACVPCWQQRQMFMTAWRHGNPYGMLRAATQGVHIATDKYLRGIDVDRKYAALPVQRPAPLRRRPGA